MSYPLGSRVHLSASFTDRRGDHIDPSTVVLKVKDPTTFEAEYTPVRDGVGRYSYDLDVDTAGEWVYRFESDGVGKAASEKTFRVSETQFVDP